MSLAKDLRDILREVSHGNTQVITQQSRDGHLMEHFSHTITKPSQLRQAVRLMRGSFFDMDSMSHQAVEYGHEVTKAHNVGLSQKAIRSSRQV